MYNTEKVHLRNWASEKPQFSSYFLQHIPTGRGDRSFREDFQTWKLETPIYHYRPRPPPPLLYCAGTVQCGTLSVTPSTSTPYNLLIF
jgi:hypothetical protein